MRIKPTLRSEKNPSNFLTSNTPLSSKFTTNFFKSLPNEMSESNTTLCIYTTPRPSSSRDTVTQMKYLNPLDFYNEIFKDILKKKDYLKPGRLLGLDVSDKYVSLAVSDWKNITAVPLGALDRQEINMSSMADKIQSLIHERNIVGFVVGTRETDPIDAKAQILILINDLFKTQKFEGLKFTDYAITSKHEEVFEQHLKFILENLPQPQPQPQDMSKTIIEKSYAVCAL